MCPKSLTEQKETKRWSDVGCCPFFLSVSWRFFPPQRSGWWPGACWEEGQGSVWVCLCDEHRHRVLLPHPGGRCVCAVFHPDTHKLSLRPRDHCIVSEGSDYDSWRVYLWKCAMFVRLCPPGSRSLSSVASLESPVICCLGPLILYLQEFYLERVLRSQRYMWSSAAAQQHRLQSVIVWSYICSLNPGWTWCRCEYWLAEKLIDNRLIISAIFHVVFLFRHELFCVFFLHQTLSP